MPLILISCFDPFGGEPTNPSMELCERLPRELGFATVETLLLPTSFARAPKALLAAVDRLGPSAVLCLGQAGGRAALSLEKIGINWMQGRIADNDGFQPAGGPILPGGPAAHFSTLPVEDMVQAVRQAGVPAELSFSAGAFVCNCLLYSLLQGLAARSLALPAGFLHLPFTPAQAAAKPSAPPSMALADMERGLRAALACLTGRL